MANTSIFSSVTIQRANANIWYFCSWYASGLYITSCVTTSCALAVVTSIPSVMILRLPFSIFRPARLTWLASSGSRHRVRFLSSTGAWHRRRTRFADYLASFLQPAVFAAIRLERAVFLLESEHLKVSLVVAHETVDCRWLKCFRSVRRFDACGLEISLHRRIAQQTRIYSARQSLVSFRRLIHTFQLPLQNTANIVTNCDNHFVLPYSYHAEYIILTHEDNKTKRDAPLKSRDTTL
jgi:hypothetical protein